MARDWLKQLARCIASAFGYTVEALALCWLHQAYAHGHSAAHSETIRKPRARARTGLVAFPDEAQLITEAALDIAVEAVVAQVRLATLEPRDVDGPFAHIEIVLHVLVHPLQPWVRAEHSCGCYVTVHTASNMRLESAA